VAVSPAERSDAATSPRTPVAPRWLKPLLIANLVGQIGIVVTGGLVRLTGSGLGCPTWPQCVPGSYTPVVTQEQGWHKDVEFGNRMLAFVVGWLALGALIAVVLHLRGGAAQHPQRRRLRWLGAFPLLGVVAQGVIGGATVRMELNPAVVALHFLVSMVLIAGSTVLLIEGAAATRTTPPAPPARPQIAWLARGLALVVAAVVVLGTVVTGSGPHSGDADEPARFGFDPRTVSWLHADAVWLFVGLVLALLLALSLTGAPRTALRRTWLLLGITLLQGVIGYTQYLLDLPIGLVTLHLLGASLLVAATTAAVHAVLWRPPGVGQSVTP
jgi:cytochrome c oxidase assembly protein subunit 15